MIGSCNSIDLQVGKGGRLVIGWANDLYGNMKIWNEKTIFFKLETQKQSF